TQILAGRFTRLWLVRSRSLAEGVFSASDTDALQFAFSADRSHAQGTNRRRWARAESHRRMGDRLSLRSAVAVAIVARCLLALPRRLRLLLRFLFRPPR